MRSCPRAGFTLLELLTAMAVLALMVVVLAQLSGITSQSVSEGLRRVDNYSKARAALDLIAQDVSNGLFRGDLAAFRDAGGSPAPVFFTRRVSIGGDRALSLVSYEWDTANLRLRRGSRAIPWSGSPGVSFGQTNSLPAAATLAPQDFQSIADGIVRLEFFFLDRSGNPQSQYDSNTATVGVALATLDAQAMELLKSTGRLDALRTFLAPAGTPSPEGVVAGWESSVRTDASFRDYPEPIRQGLRFFQRSFPINRQG